MTKALQLRVSGMTAARLPRVFLQHSAIIQPDFAPPATTGDRNSPLKLLYFFQILSCEHFIPQNAD
jgi:hypothetical protein